MIKLSVLLLVAAAVCRGQTITTYSNANAGAIHNVCLAPVDAQMVRAGMKGGETLTEESEKWGEKLGKTFVAAILDAGGRNVPNLSPDSPPEARELVTRIRRRYDSIGPQMLKKRGGVRQGRYTLGDEIALLPCARDADAVAFIDASAVTQTKGRKTFSILTGGFAGPLIALNSYKIYISFVDARTGQVQRLMSVRKLGGKMGEDPEVALKKRLVEEFKRAAIGATLAPSVRR